jgi:YD repeat-containing protein
MVEGLTVADDIVLDDDDDQDDGDQGAGDPGKGTGGDTGGHMSNLSDEPARSEYRIVRNEGDPLGQPTSIQYRDGNSVNFEYDENGNLIKMTDTASGVSFTQAGDNVVVSGNGQQTAVKGTMEVNPQDGSMIIKTEDGNTITFYPNGRSTTVDENGDLVRMTNPAYREGDRDKYQTSIRGGSAAYDDEHNLIRVQDNIGNVYERTPDGGWLKTDFGGVTKPFDGEVTFDPYRGVVVTPANSQGIGH